MRPHLEPALKTIADPPERDRWARLRFLFIGPLMAAPPASQQLGSALLALAAKTWRHPVSGLDVRFGTSTIERWYCRARRAADPVAALKDELRGDEGCFPSLTPVVVHHEPDSAAHQQRSRAGAAQPGAQTQDLRAHAQPAR